MPITHYSARTCIRLGLTVLAFITGSVFAQPQGGSATAQPLGAEQKHDYSRADQRAAAASAAIEKSPLVLGKFLGEGLTDPREKLRAVYQWMALRMNYDTAAYRKGVQITQTAQQALDSRMSSCDGFSTLFADLAKHAGVEVQTVLGYVKDGFHQKGEAFKDTNHAWNAVRLDSQWYLIDSTWGAGFDDGTQFVRKFDAFYFLTPADHLHLSHLAKDPAQRFGRSAKDTAEFAALPYAPVTLLSVAKPSAAEVEQSKSVGFVKTFAQASGNMHVDVGPLVLNLRAGNSYTWQISSPHYHEMAVLHKGQWTDFAASTVRPIATAPRTSFNANFSPSEGVVQIAAKKTTDADYTIVLEYIAK
jgi:Transglutaminase-like superfamily